MPAEITSTNVPVKLWAKLDEVESAALTQLRKTAMLPWVHHHVAAMPDVHLGVGATVGSVIAMKGAVSPAAVGVDIGCGMAAIRTSLSANDLPDSLGKLRSSIEAAIPVGNGDAGARNTPSRHATTSELWSEWSTLHTKVQDQLAIAQRQCGTLGGGNHFVELCLDTERRVWIMLHSGSRKIGKLLAEIHIAKAKTLAHNETIIDRDLAVFLAGTKEMQDYRRDLYWAQRYAAANRGVMIESLKEVLADHFPRATFEPTIACHHNYVAEEHHFGEDVFVTRKGAISARAGELGIIPGSMGTKSYVVRGLGCADSFCSASHGAGRRMSRGAARKAYTLDDLARQTAGVECRKDGGVLDEIPSAYKNIDRVMENQQDLVAIEHELKQILCVKG
jgi:tRNA-splicing ligase RtcB